MCGKLFTHALLRMYIHTYDINIYLQCVVDFPFPHNSAPQTNFLYLPENVRGLGNILR